MSLFRWLKPNRRTSEGYSRPSTRRPRYQPRLELLENRLAPAVINVTTAADELTAGDGAVSLREAITAINAGSTLNDANISGQTPGNFGSGDTINFAIAAAGVQTLNLSSPLPTITKPVLINGYSQGTSSPNALASGDNAALLVQLSGNNGNFNGLTLGSGSAGSTIQGLAINGFGGVGIEVTSNSNTIAGDFVGTNPTGLNAVPNSNDGIRIDFASNNIIGGTTAAARNIVSGNILDGIHIVGTPAAPASGNVVEGNFVGVSALGNSSVGTRPSANNAGAAAGSAAGNGLFGLEISGGSANTIGGTSTSARNVVGFNTDGIEIDNGGQNNTIEGNFVGVGLAADGVTLIAVGNIGHGIALRSAGNLPAPLGPGQTVEPTVSGNVIGGLASNAGNVIEFNGSAGVGVFGNPLGNNANAGQNAGNSIEGNSIFANGRNNPTALLGIDLANQFVYPNDDGSTPNDSRGHGATSDPNNFQNFPLLTSADQVSGGVQITGSLNQAAAPGTAFRIEFFASNNDPQGGIPEGQTFLGFTNVTSNASGQLSFSMMLFTNVTPGQLITATATSTSVDPSTPAGSVNVGNTSEFSAAVVVNQAVITSAKAVTFTAGSANTFSFTTTGVPTPTLTEHGALPAGIAFTDNGTPTLSGTPAAGTGGIATLTITAHNGVGSDATQAFTLTVQEAPAILSANTATFPVGAAGTFTVTTHGFPRPALSVSSKLPAGITFTDQGNGTATLAGTPAAGTGGAYPLTITAHSSFGGDATQAFTLLVVQSPAITSPNSTTFAVGAGNLFTVTANGFPSSTFAESGTLPSGVSFNSNTGVLSGTPAAGTAGNYALTFTPANSVGTGVAQSFTLTLLDAPQGVNFGSAPDGPSFPPPNTYPTLLASNGARHIITGLRLGNTVTASADGQPSATAADGAADGVTFLSPLVAGGVATVKVNVQGAPSSGAKLDAWVDFNHNGSWLDVGEQIFASVAVVNGDNVLSFAVPGTATVTSTTATFARFRLSTAGGLAPTGLAVDGEVEDYGIGLAPAPATVYVSPSFTQTAGTDPDGSGPATAVGFDAFTTIQQALNAVKTGGTVVVEAGTYKETLILSRPVVLKGAGSATTILSGSNAGAGLTLTTASAAVISGLTVQGYFVGLLVGPTTTFLSLTDVHLRGNQFGSTVNGVNTFLYQGGSGNDTIFINPHALAEPGDNPLFYNNVRFLTVDGGGGNNRLVVFLNDTNAPDTLWDTGSAFARDKAFFLMFYRDTGGSWGEGIVVVLGDGPETVVVQGQQTNAPTTIYGEGGNDTFNVSVTASSAYANLTLDGGPGSDTVGIFDQSGGGGIRNRLLPDGTGEFDVTYANGSASAIHYQNMEQTLSNALGFIAPTLPT